MARKKNREWLHRTSACKIKPDNFPNNMSLSSRCWTVARHVIGGSPSIPVDWQINKLTIRLEKLAGRPLTRIPNRFQKYSRPTYLEQYLVPRTTFDTWPSGRNNLPPQLIVILIQANNVRSSNREPILLSCFASKSEMNFAHPSSLTVAAQPRLLLGDSKQLRT